MFDLQVWDDLPVAAPGTNLKWKRLYENKFARFVYNICLFVCVCVSVCKWHITRIVLKIKCGQTSLTHIHRHTHSQNCPKLDLNTQAAILTIHIRVNGTKRQMESQRERERERERLRAIYSFVSVKQTSHPDDLNCIRYKIIHNHMGCCRLSQCKKHNLHNNAS